MRLHARYGRGIYSHDTALYFHDLTDRTPLSYTMTFPSHYHARSLKSEGINGFYVARQNHGIGKVEHLSPFGRSVHTYNIERTICDIIRNRKSSILHEGIKRYAALKHRDIHKLMQYAKVFRVEKQVRQHIEKLL